MNQATNHSRQSLHQDSEIELSYIRLGDEAVYTLCPTSRDACGTLLFSHGLSEHALRFLRFGRAMAGRGWRVVLLHLLGHGVRAADAPIAHDLARAYLSDDANQTLQYIETLGPKEFHAFKSVRQHNLRVMATTKMADHLDQVEAVGRAIVDGTLGFARSSDEPILISGHSLGGAVASAGALRLVDANVVRPAGVVLFAPAFRAIAPPHTGRIGQCIVELSWKTQTQPVMRPLGPVLRAIPSMNIPLKTGWASPYVTDIPTEIELHRRDPLIMDRISSRYVIRIEPLMAELHRRHAEFTFDLLAFAGDRDAVVDTRGLIEFADRVQADLVIYKNFQPHSPLHSTRCALVMDKIDQWVMRYT